jgi:acyl-CoA thioester hydrolase
MPAEASSEHRDPEPPANPGRRVRLEYRVPYADTDQMQVVYYANYLEYFERVRNEIIRECGLSYKEWEARGLMCPVIEAHCEYILPATYDDLIAIDGWLVWAQGSRFRVEYEILRGAERLAIGHTIHNTMTPEGAPRRVPKEVQALLGKK